MINRDNFRSLLDKLGFVVVRADYYTYTGVGYSMSVDFSKGELIYPEDKGLTIYERTTCDFHQNENFVVFECVYQLLQKGYQSQDIALEVPWQLGHDQKSGRADIVISHDDKVFLIIECKTEGVEFTNAVKDTEKDGAQLFSYWQQENSTKWLALYSSDVDGIHKCKVISCTDDKNILESSKSDDRVLTYERAHNDKEKFRVWSEVYGKEWFDDIIFGVDSSAYNLKVKPLHYADLQVFGKNTIVNSFLEILRHNNVSDKENAFNRLIALFICKLVDEKEPAKSGEVRFVYRHGESYESLQDRLQSLHQRGMQEFLKEDVFYVKDTFADDLFARYQGKNKEHAISELSETIKRLKYYTNNDFAFKDVHNRELFLQNGRVLVEVVQLFQPYKIFYTEQNQFLGDLFEKLLNKGFKQDEGQFFTPTPITHFIWDSLPVQEYIDFHGVPKVIDYACGAGHFLTEGISAINAHHHLTETDIVTHFYGIEKDYRLARVSKIALFMNGAGSANIIFGDGLDNYPDKNITSNSFDILVANPPYAVKGFKNYLELRNNTLTIVKDISDKGGEIEVLFVERIAQLLKPQGIAAVVLPVSILTTNKGTYTLAREEILKHFYIRAIVSFASGTFVATNTATVTLFLEKYNEPPKVAKIVEDTVESIMSNTAQEDWGEVQTLRHYCQYQGISETDYKLFLQERLRIDAHPYFKDYPDYKTALDVEKQKLYYFALAEAQQTLIIVAPTDKEGNKVFLGYEWKGRRGSEGIKINTPGGMLYNPMNRYAEGTLACCIRNTFSIAKAQLNVTNVVTKYANTYPLYQLLDLDKVDFNKTISLTPRGGGVQQQVTSKYPLLTIGELATTIETGSRPQGGVGSNTGEVLSLGGEHIDNTSGYINLTSPKYVPKGFYEKVTRGRLKEGDLLICKDGALSGKVALVREELNGIPAMINEHVFIVRCNEQVTQKFLFYFLSTTIGQGLLHTQVTGSAQGGINSTNLKSIKIPCPNLTIQTEIVTTCEVVDKEVSQAQQIIAQAKGSIQQLTDKYQLNSYPTEKLERLLLDVKGSSMRIPNDQVQLTGKYPVISQETDNLITGYTDNEDCITDLPLIVFGDHSCSFKYVDFPFLRGADGTQLLKTDETQIYVKFLYYFLPFCPITNKGHYERHFKYLKDILIPLPPLSVQEALVGEAEGYDAQIAEAQKVIDDSAVRKEKIVKDYVG